MDAALRLAKRWKGNSDSRRLAARYTSRWPECNDTACTNRVIAFVLTTTVLHQKRHPQQLPGYPTSPSKAPVNRKPQSPCAPSVPESLVPESDAQCSVCNKRSTSGSYRQVTASHCVGHGGRLVWVCCRSAAAIRS
jgi:hypothetical protein